MNTNSLVIMPYSHICDAVLIYSLDPLPRTPSHMHILSKLCRCDTTIPKSKLETVINDTTLSSLKLDVLLSMCLLIYLQNRDTKQSLSEHLSEMIMPKIIELNDSTPIHEHINDFIDEYVDAYMLQTEYIVQNNFTDTLFHYKKMNEYFVKEISNSLNGELANLTNRTDDALNILNTVVELVEPLRMQRQKTFATMLNSFFIDETESNKILGGVLNHCADTICRILQGKIPNGIITAYTQQVFKDIPMNIHNETGRNIENERGSARTGADGYVDIYNTPTIYDQTNQMSHIKYSINNKFKNYGLEIYIRGELKQNHDIFDCLVEYGIYDSRNTAAVILSGIIQQFRDVPYFMDNNNDTSVFGMYDLIAIANDSTMSFEIFLAHLRSNNKLTADFLVEFILRIVSRVYNVNIMLFAVDVSTQILIDNTIEENPRMLNLYHYGMGYQFLLMPIGGKFKFYDLDDKRKQIETKYGTELNETNISSSQNSHRSIDSVVKSKITDITEI